MPNNSRKEQMAHLLQEIVDRFIAPEHNAAAEVTEARKILVDYWRSRAATLHDSQNRRPDWLKRRTTPSF